MTSRGYFSGKANPPPIALKILIKPQHHFHVAHYKYPSMHYIIPQMRLASRMNKIHMNKLNSIINLHHPMLPMNNSGLCHKHLQWLCLPAMWCLHGIMPFCTLWYALLHKTALVMQGFDKIAVGMNFSTHKGKLLHIYETFIRRSLIKDHEPVIKQKRRLDLLSTRQI